MSEPLDTQQVEVLGRNLLVTALVSSGLEVARPERDRGVDLIAYLDLEGEAFSALPLQMKAASGRVVSVDEKYRRLPWLHIVYAWHVREPAEARFFCLSPSEALDLAAQLGWMKTKAWSQGGRYAANNPSARVQEALAPYEMRTPEDWVRKVRGARAR
ncbi:MAG: hypothetical protein M3P46_02925 [Actinomycetota bacterium]|nr:hypothetical protein [Actinomycetota bacterium]